MSDNKKAFANLGYAQMFIEVKDHDRQDYFVDPPQNASVNRSTRRFVRRFEGLDSLAQNDLGQIIAYANEACAKQHRVAYYSVSLRGIKARLIRWDRSGAIATEEFDLHKNPGFLCEFLWRFSKGTSFQRGFDDTVRRASDADEQVFRRVLQDHVRLQGGYTEETRNFLGDIELLYVPGKVYIIQAFESGSRDRPREYLVSRPIVSPHSITGRAMRGYWEVSRELETIAFMKDVWRWDVEPSWLEGDILQKLMDAEVPYIPRLSCHGDVPVPEEAGSHVGLSFYLAPLLSLLMLTLILGAQVTQNHCFFRAPWVCGANLECGPRLSRLTHYRLVVETVGWEMYFIRGTSELLHTTFNVFQGEPHA